MDDVDYVDEGVESSEATSESAEELPPAAPADPKAKARPGVPAGAVCKREARPPQNTDVSAAHDPSAEGTGAPAVAATEASTMCREAEAGREAGRELRARDPPAGGDTSGRAANTAEPRARRNTRPPRGEESEVEREEGRSGRGSMRACAACAYCWQTCWGGVAGMEQHQRSSGYCQEWQDWYRRTGSTPEQWMSHYARQHQPRRPDSLMHWDMPGKGSSSGAYPRRSWEDSVRPVSPPRQPRRGEDPRTSAPARRRETKERARSPSDKRSRPPAEAAGPPESAKGTAPPSKKDKTKKRKGGEAKTRRPSPTPSPDPRHRRRRRSPSGSDRDGPPQQPKFTVRQTDAKSFLITLA